MRTVSDYINGRHFEDTSIGEDACKVDNVVIYKGSISDKEYLKAKKAAQEEWNIQMYRKEYIQKRNLHDLR
jgi:hypothetical protein